MTKEHTLELKQIVIDDDIQPRTKIDQATAEEYAQEMREGRWEWKRHPLPVVFVDEHGVHRLAAGFHRMEGCKLAFKRTMPVEIRPGGKRDAILYAAGTNSDHGLRRSNTDKRRAILKLLNDPEWTKWSDREIARHCMVHNDTVSSIRKELSVGIRQIETTRTVVRNETIYEMTTGNIGKSEPSHPDQRNNSDSDPDTAEAVSDDYTATSPAPIETEQSDPFNAELSYFVNHDNKVICIPGFSSFNEADQYRDENNTPAMIIGGKVLNLETRYKDYSRLGVDWTRPVHATALINNMARAEHLIASAMTISGEVIKLAVVIEDDPQGRANLFKPGEFNFMSHHDHLLFIPGFASDEEAVAYREQTGLRAMIIRVTQIIPRLDYDYKDYRIVRLPTEPALSTATRVDVATDAALVETSDPVDTVADPLQSDPPPEPVTPRPWFMVIDSNLFYSVDDQKKAIDPVGFPSFDAARRVHTSNTLAIRRGNRLLDAFKFSKQYADYTLTADAPAAPQPTPPADPAIPFDLNALGVYLDNQTDKLLITTNFGSYERARHDRPSVALYSPVDGTYVRKHWVDRYANYKLLTLAEFKAAERAALRFHVGEDWGFCPRCDKYHDVWRGLNKGALACSFCDHQEHDDTIKIQPLADRPYTDTARSRWEAGRANAVIQSGQPQPDAQPTEADLDRIEQHVMGQIDLLFAHGRTEAVTQHIQRLQASALA